MNTDLLGLIFTRLRENDQIALSTSSSFLFSAFTITKLIQTNKLTTEILERKSIIDGEYLWAHLRYLNVSYNQKIKSIPPFLNDKLIALSAEKSSINDAGIAHLRKLKYLNISYNSHITSIPAFLNDKLIALSAQGYTSGMSDKGIAPLQKLKYLDIRANPYIENIPPALNDTLIKLFSIKGNRIKKL